VRTLRPTKKRPDGWFTNAYGELAKGTTLQRGQAMPKGTRLSWVSVVAAGSSAPQVNLEGNQVTVTREKPATFTIP
jgi:hypothetical protein